MKDVLVIGKHVRLSVYLFALVLLLDVACLSADGFRVIYDREVPFELRVQESADGPQQVGTLEAIKVKVLMLVSRTYCSHCSIARGLPAVLRKS